MNVTNQNFVPIQIVEFDIQGLIDDVIVGKNKIVNLTSIPSRSQKSVSLIRIKVNGQRRANITLSRLSHSTPSQSTWSSWTAA